MKKTSQHIRLRKGGILQWSTLCLLAGGSVALNSCDSESTCISTPEDAKMAGLQKQLDEIESRKGQLMNGELENNFELPGLGFYHAEAGDFFPYRHGHSKDSKWFSAGEWLEYEPAAPYPSATRPTPVALEKIQQLLEREQALAEKSGSGNTVTHHHHGGGGMGNMLMMYWLLSGNRGAFTPGAGFQNAQRQESGWRRSVDQGRQTVSSYAASNPGYSRLVEQSKASGARVTPGSSVRGGFGSSSRVGSSFGS
jgi:hypothetical protein